MGEHYHQMDLFHDYSFSDSINAYLTGSAFVFPCDEISGIDEDGNPYIETSDICEEPPIEDLQPKKIIFSPPATVVIWANGMKTVVKCKEGTEFNPYYGFTCALAKKIYQSNEKIKRMIKEAEYQNEERK